MANMSMLEYIKCSCAAISNCRCNARFNGTMSVDEFIASFDLTQPQIDALKALRASGKLR